MYESKNWVLIVSEYLMCSILRGARGRVEVGPASLRSPRLVEQVTGKGPRLSLLKGKGKVMRAQRKGGPLRMELGGAERAPQRRRHLNGV